MASRTPTIVFVGGGPSTAAMLERISASRAELLDGKLLIHVVDPFIPGSGRIWRFDQDPGLMLNSRAADVTMFTDSSVNCEGPAIDGPNLADWAAQLVAGTLPDSPILPWELMAEARTLGPETFPTRRLQSFYLEWFFKRAVAALAPDAAVQIHQDTVIDVESAVDGYQVKLDGGTELSADAVVVAVGHCDALPDSRSSEWKAFAHEHGGFHAAPSYTTDIDYSPIAPGQDVIVTGMGLAFIDLLVLLTEGRGGRFTENADGSYVYLPSGREPRLWAGSRRGVPYHSKARGDLRGPGLVPARYLTSPSVNTLLAHHAELDFRDHLWPLIAKDIGYTYYQELFAGKHAAPTLAWEEFAKEYEAINWYSHARNELVARAISQTSLHLDFERLDHPFAGRTFATTEHFESALLDYVRDDLQFRDSGLHPESQALFLGLLRAYVDLGTLVPLDRLNAASHLELQSWWHGFFSSVDSGPPPHRLRQLIALHEAGVLRFLGPNVEIELDHTLGEFVASSPQISGQTRARALIEARLPSATVARSANPLLANLHAKETITEQQLLFPDGILSTGRLLVSENYEVVGGSALSRPGLFAVGPATTAGAHGAFARPNSNGPSFRANDALARGVLRHVSASIAQPLLQESKQP